VRVCPVASYASCIGVFGVLEPSVLWASTTAVAYCQLTEQILESSFGESLRYPPCAVFCVVLSNICGCEGPPCGFYTSW